MLAAPVSSRPLRASAAFVLLPFDALSPAAQERLSDLRDDPELFGVLKPVDPLLPAKSVSKQAALLFLTLQRPQKIPTLLASIFGADTGRLERLVLDGILEVEHDGAFLSGPDAQRLFAPARASAGTHSIARLSAAAIECATAYESLDAMALARRVYDYGRLPCTPELRRRLRDDVGLLAFLTAGDVAGTLLSRWTASAPDDGPWLSFSTERPTARLTHKLYVSARLDAMPRVFAIAIRALARVGCDRFKIGRRGEGACRPDKMVAYFPSLDVLRECAVQIEAEIATIPPTSAHGVPFTAGIDAAGFLSWGMDPPELGQVTDAMRFQSWRQWIASRVASAVLSAKSADDVVAFVLKRLELEGIDPASWTLDAAVWRDHAARPEDVA